MHSSFYSSAVGDRFMHSYVSLKAPSMSANCYASMNQSNNRRTMDWWATTLFVIHCILPLQERDIEHEQYESMWVRHPDSEKKCETSPTSGTGLPGYAFRPNFRTPYEERWEDKGGTEKRELWSVICETIQWMVKHWKHNPLVTMQWRMADNRWIEKWQGA